MKGFNESWTRADAVQNLFFCELSGELAEVGDKQMHELIILAFYYDDPRSSSLPRSQQQILFKVAQAIKAAMPHFSPTSTLHPILWSRWALQSSALPISNKFWLNFAQWRASKKPVYIKLMQHYDPITKTWRGRVLTTPGVGKTVGYTMDQMLARKSFAFNEYAVKWRVKSVQFEVAQTPKVHPRTIEKVCGQDVMRLLANCIQLEAKSGKLGVLSDTLLDGKYNSKVGPAELLKELHSAYPTLKLYRDSTLRRGLSAFVRCPRGRPGGLRKSY